MSKRNAMKFDAEEAEAVTDAVDSVLPVIQKLTDIGFLPLNDATLGKLKRAKVVLDRG